MYHTILESWNESSRALEDHSEINDFMNITRFTFDNNYKIFFAKVLKINNFKCFVI